MFGRSSADRLEKSFVVLRDVDLALILLYVVEKNVKNM
jgi:hypothetical protein